MIDPIDETAMHCWAACETVKRKKKTNKVKIIFISIFNFDSLVVDVIIIVFCVDSDCLIASVRLLANRHDYHIIPA